MKKVLKIFIILVLILIININNVYALQIIDTNEFEPDSSMTDDDYLIDRANIIVTVIRNVGIVIAVITLMIIGVKSMFASSEERSEYKQALPGYIIGAFLIAAMSALPSLIYYIVSKW